MFVKLYMYISECLATQIRGLWRTYTEVTTRTYTQISAGYTLYKESNFRGRILVAVVVLKIDCIPKRTPTVSFQRTVFPGKKLNEATCLCYSFSDIIIVFEKKKKWITGLTAVIDVPTGIVTLLFIQSWFLIFDIHVIRWTSNLSLTYSELAWFHFQQLLYYLTLYIQCSTKSFSKHSENW